MQRVNDPATIAGAKKAVAYVLDMSPVDVLGYTVIAILPDGSCQLSSNACCQVAIAADLGSLIDSLIRETHGATPCCGCT